MLPVKAFTAVGMWAYPTDLNWNSGIESRYATYSSIGFGVLPPL